MEHRTPSSFMCIPLFFLSFQLLFSYSSSSSVHAYKNYTVGDDLGWFDNTEKSVDYQKWASGKSFSLGDFLVFNSNNNHSVIQTYNVTTYKQCDSDEAEAGDTTEWSVTNPSSTATSPVSVAVPLLKQGMTYFFSGDYDGDQCKSGQHFMVNVTHGKGLPESLKDPSEQTPGPTSPDDEDSTPNPDTVVSSNFDHPKESRGEVDDDGNVVKKTSGSDSLIMLPRNANGVIGLLVFLWVLC